MCSMKALLVGIDNYDIPNKGCVNDVLITRYILRLRHSVLEQDIRMLANARATKSAILERLEWLISYSKKVENLFFYFSGNGAQLPLIDYSTGLGASALDEILCPTDFSWNKNNGITSDDIYQIIKLKEKTCRLVLVFDCCYAGNVFTLGQNPSDILFHSRSKAIDTPPDILSRINGFDVRKLVEVVGFGERFWGFEKDNNPVEKPTIKNKAFVNAANTIVVSACSDWQIAADANFKNRHQGAFSYCMQKFLYYHPELSIKDLEENTTRYLKSFGFSQFPTFIVGRETNSRKFIITT